MFNPSRTPGLREHCSGSAAEKLPFPIPSIRCSFPIYIPAASRPHCGIRLFRRESLCITFTCPFSFISEWVISVSSFNVRYGYIIFLFSLTLFSLFSLYSGTGNNSRRFRRFNSATPHHAHRSRYYPAPALCVMCFVSCGARTSASGPHRPQRS